MNAGFIIITKFVLCVAKNIMGIADKRRMNGMRRDIDLQNAQTTILYSINGIVHIACFGTEEWEGVQFLLKRAVAGVVPTAVEQRELREFLGVGK